MPTRFDFTVWRGNSLPPIAFAWPDGYSAGSGGERLSLFVGDDELLSVQVGSGLVIDAAHRQFLWDITMDQSRMIPLGTIVSYELEDVTSGETTILNGFITGAGGSNTDSDITVGPGTLNYSSGASPGWPLMGWVA